jgi:hypothetical protein
MMNCAECTAAKMGILLNYSTVIWATGDVAYIAEIGLFSPYMDSPGRIYSPGGRASIVRA